MNRFLKCFVVAAMLSSVTLASGCATFSALWQQFEANPVQTASQLVTYVMNFLQGAQTVWNLILPLIGSANPQANVDFNNAVVTATNAVAALQDAVQAAVAANNPNPDLSALIKDVTSAVDAVMAIVNQYRAPSAKIGASVDGLIHQQNVIHHWK